MSYKHKSQQFSQTSMPMKITYSGKHENGQPINTLIRIFNPKTGERVSAIMITRSATNKLSYTVIGSEKPTRGRKSKKRRTRRKKVAKTRKRKLKKNKRKTRSKK